MQEEGKISVTAEDMLPIIKKWLYSEHDIFLRELVSNAVDAITKHEHFVLTGESSQKDVEYKIEVAVNETNKTIHIKDNGVGMTAEEVKKYITQLAFSGATEFFEKYQAGDESSRMIGHFGLGFYSSFMVADKVEIKTLSFRDESKPVHWVCNGTTDYTLKEIDGIEHHGTEIILHINEESQEFINPAELSTVIRRHSAFLPVPIMVNGEIINNQKPIWNQNPNELEDKDYDELFNHSFPMQEKPLFNLHFKIDTPFQVRGILYFQKVRQNFDSFKGRIKLYCNNVFVSDSIEDLFPSYLFMLQGFIDCPDIPLNVSRSSLQGDPRVKKIAQHMVKKIADKMKEIFKKDREAYEGYWEDINPFVKFGCLQDDKFYDRMEEYVIFKSTKEDKFSTLKEYLERNKDKHENKVYYVSNFEEQHSYLELFKDQDIEVLLMDDTLDSHYVQTLEMKNPDVKFARIDSELDEVFIDKEKDSKIVDQENKTREDSIREVFIGALNNEKITVRVENLKSEDVSGMILLPEHIRRFREMSAVSQPENLGFIEEHTFVVNAQNPVVSKLVEMHKGLKYEETSLICQHLYDLALLSQKQFDGKKMASFVERSNKILNLLGSN
ncbi:MAG: molecular chaperone HtpG [bacterium]|nr:molecular chaperone HtpG [bacterium]